MKATVFDFLCSALVNSRTFFPVLVGRMFFISGGDGGVCVGGGQFFLPITFFLNKPKILNNLKYHNRMYVRVS